MRNFIKIHNTWIDLDRVVSVSKVYIFEPSLYVDILYEFIDKPRPLLLPSIEIVDPKFYNDNLEYRFDDVTLKHFNLETHSEREKRFNICSKHERFKEVLEIYDKWVEVNIIDVMKNMEKRV